MRFEQEEKGKQPILHGQKDIKKDANRVMTRSASLKATSCFRNSGHHWTKVAGNTEIIYDILTGTQILAAQEPGEALHSRREQLPMSVYIY